MVTYREERQREETEGKRQRGEIYERRMERDRGEQTEGNR